METLGCVMHFQLARVLRAICYCIAKGISEILVASSHCCQKVFPPQQFELLSSMVPGHATSTIE